MAKQTAEEKQALVKELQEILEQGNHKVYTVLNHVSSSGMTRAISCFVAIGEGELQKIDWYITQLTGFKFDNKYGGLKVSGCGMDMGFHLVYNLSNRLYCPDKYNHDAAYKLQHRWMN